MDFAPDSLTNNEFGWKTTWMDRRIQWNGAIYQEDWNDAQINVGAIGVFSANGVSLNGGNYRVRGVETSAVARVATRAHYRGWRRVESQRASQAGDIPVGGRNTDRLQLAADLESRDNVPNPGGALGSSLAGAPAVSGQHPRTL